MFSDSKLYVMYILLNLFAPGSGGERKTLSRLSRIASLILLCREVIHACIISAESACNVWRLQETSKNKINFNAPFRMSRVMCYRKIVRLTSSVI